MLILNEINFAIDAKNEKLFAYPLDNAGSPILSGAIEINSIDNDHLRHEFGKFLHALIIPEHRICHVCGISFQSKHSNRTTHNDACRSAKRHIVNKLQRIGANKEDFLSTFSLYASSLNAGELELAKDYLLVHMKEYEAIINALSPKDLKYLILSNQHSK